MLYPAAIPARALSINPQPTRRLPGLVAAVAVLVLGLGLALAPGCRAADAAEAPDDDCLALRQRVIELRLDAVGDLPEADRAGQRAALASATDELVAGCETWANAVVLDCVEAARTPQASTACLLDAAEVAD